ncbi:DUF6269 family protein [Streptomyces endocoffeicus]|uniref:DUF6269 family protein n=1 Tax=Streptomyces endocoffeicus TaxID=2898945 RepID=UPI0035576362
MRRRSSVPVPVTQQSASRPMTDDPTSPAATEPPWAFLARLEEQIALDQEACLRDCGAPWGELLERFVDALTGRPCPDREADADAGDAANGAATNAPSGPGVPSAPGSPGGPNRPGSPSETYGPGEPSKPGEPSEPSEPDAPDGPRAPGPPGSSYGPHGPSAPSPGEWRPPPATP